LPRLSHHNVEYPEPSSSIDEVVGMTWSMKPIAEYDHQGTKFSKLIDSLLLRDFSQSCCAKKCVRNACQDLIEINDFRTSSGWFGLGLSDVIMAS
jgi:hypothetical protein